MMSGNASELIFARPPSYLTEKVIGASHIRTGKPCQDAAGSLVVDDIVAVAVADGHGSSRYADVGARLAVQVALTALVQFAEDLGHRGASISEVQGYASYPLRVQIVREWADRVRAMAGTSEAALLDYGSTLLFAVATRDFLLLGQLGDGDILLVGSDREVSVVIPADPRAFADETPSLCLPEAWLSLRVRVLPAPREECLLLLSTDGYSKSYTTDDVFRQIGPDYLDLVREGGTHGLAPHLHGFLEQVTAQGSGDDIAIAMLYWAPVNRDSERVEPTYTVEAPQSDSAWEMDRQDAGESDPLIAPDAPPTDPNSVIGDPPAPATEITNLPVVSTVSLAAIVSAAPIHDQVDAADVEGNDDPVSRIEPAAEPPGDAGEALTAEPVQSEVSQLDPASKPLEATLELAANLGEDSMTDQVKASPTTGMEKIDA